MQLTHITRFVATGLLMTMLQACGGNNALNNDNGQNPGGGDPTEGPDVTLDTRAVKMADSIITRSPSGYGGWNYETGTVLRGFEELYKATGEQIYFDYLKTTVDSVIDEQGNISTYRESEYNLDQIKEGSLVLYLYEETGEERYKIAAETLDQQLQNQPTTNNGGFWHKNKYPWQMWLDGLYMAEPFSAHYGVVFDEPQHFDSVMLQMQLMEQHTLDDQTGLLYHAWDESGNSWWADRRTNRSPVFWGRAIGWYLMALVDVLDYMPEEYTEYRATLIDILQRQVAAVSVYQDDNGVWWQVLDKPGQQDNWAESSATAMIVYAIAKGVRKGYLDPAHITTAEKGWAGLNEAFIVENSDGTLSLTDTCEGTSVGPSYSFYTDRRKMTNDHKGLGPYLTAGVEMEYLRPAP